MYANLGSIRESTTHFKKKKSECFMEEHIWASLLALTACFVVIFYLTDWLLILDIK
jgi:hypothetical protein